MITFILMLVGWVVYFVSLASGDTHFSAMAFGFFASSILVAVLPDDL